MDEELSVQLQVDSAPENPISRRAARLTMRESVDTCAELPQDGRRMIEMESSRDDSCWDGDWVSDASLKA